ncbi:uncharacterized protein EV422DRAFT_418157 [Fimicolochytrium jonesii]|uniref:uncharacterized protein n=1 Tax=Fimicolochytrium jonesii TaxID=1396493 RepID=UPI0022FE1F28|nr:uncharacterized protein EV422DRAFT_418157 [Fimicolochytrium jonesii]KAI8822131.1 hypothetical protein EV422DRAFT_418157 [Fimicolochytrium jonesii]
MSQPDTSSFKVPSAPASTRSASLKFPVGLQNLDRFRAPNEPSPPHTPPIAANASLFNPYSQPRNKKTALEESVVRSSQENSGASPRPGMNSMEVVSQAKRSRSWSAQDVGSKRVRHGLEPPAPIRPHVATPTQTKNRTQSFGLPALMIDEGGMHTSPMMASNADSWFSPPHESRARAVQIMAEPPLPGKLICDLQNMGFPYNFYGSLTYSLAKATACTTANRGEPASKS